jgi:tape measure domain-containing protein
MEYFADASNQAKEYIRELEDFAAYTPFSTESAISMAQYLQAMSVPINSSKAVLKVISDTAAATGATEENMQRIVTALGQILTKGKLAAEEVRQLANANIPIYDILKEQLKLTGQEIKNLGKLNINASKAVVAILDGLNERYKGASEKIANTLGGMTETIKDDALIIGEALFHGTLDRLEERVTKIRDRLDEWRDIALHFGTGGMITSIIEDLDPEGKLDLEQYVLAAVAGFKNLGDTIKEFTTRNGNLLKTFAATGYSAIMSLTIAGDYLLRTFNMLQRGGETVVDIINKLTGMSLSLSDVVAGLLVFKTVGNTIMFAGNTALWAGKQFVTLGTSLASMIPIVSSAGVVTQGLTSGLITLALAAAAAYGGLKLIQGATGVSGDSALVTDEYTKQMEEYNEALNQWRESLNQDYSSIADNWAAQMSDALDSTEKKAKKTAKKIEKTWLMSFDEVFQIREDPVTKGLDDKLEKFEDIDWGQFFTLPEFRFPERLADELTQPAYSLTDAINTAQENVGVLNRLLPALIAGTGIIATVIKNRRDYLDTLKRNNPNGPDGPDDSLLSDKELYAKLDEEIKQEEKLNKLVSELSDKYEAETKARNASQKAMNDALSRINELERQSHLSSIKVARDPSDTNKAILKGIEEQLAIARKEYTLLNMAQPDTAARTLYAKQATQLSKESNKLLNNIYKHQARLGEATPVDTTASTKAAELINAERINDSLDFINKSIIEYNETSANYNATLRKYLLNPEDTTVAKQISELNSRLSGQLSSIETTTKKVSKDIINHTYKYGSTNALDTDIFKGVLNSNFNAVQSRLADISRAISLNDIDTLASAYAGVTADIKKIRDASELIESLSVGHGIPIDAEAFAKISQKLSVLDQFSAKFSNYVELSNLLQTYQAQNKINPGTVPQATIDHIKERLATIARDATDGNGSLLALQDTIRGLDDTAGEAIEKLGILKGEVTKLKSILTTANTERIGAVYSIASEIRDLALNTRNYYRTSPQRFSVLTDILNDVYKDIDALGSKAITKEISSNLLDEIKAIFNGYDAWYSDDVAEAAFSSFSSNIEKAISEAAGDTLKRIDTLQSEIRLIGLKGIQETEFNAVNKNIEGIIKELGEIKISNAGYNLEAQLAKSFDDFTAKIEPLINSTTGDVKKMYSAMLSTVANGGTAKEVEKSLNALFRANSKAMSVGNTAEDVIALLDNTQLSKLVALSAHSQAEIASTVKQVAAANKTDAIQARLIDSLDNSAEDIEDGIKEFINAVNELGATNNSAWRTLQDFKNGRWTEILTETADDNAKMATIQYEAIRALPDEVAEKITKATRPKQLDELYNQIASLSRKEDKLMDAADKWINDQNAAINKAIANNTAGSFDVTTAREFVDEQRKIFSKLLDLDATAADAVKANKTVDYFEWLKKTFDKRGGNPGNFSSVTGAFKVTEVEAYMNNMFKDFLRGENAVLKNELAAANAIMRIGLFEGSMTAQGTTAQGALAKAFGQSLTDEIAESTDQIIQRTIGEAFNTRLRSVLDSMVDSLNLGGSAVGYDGKAAVYLNDIATYNKQTYGVVQRIFESADSANKAFKVLDNLGEVIEGGIARTISVTKFVEAMRDVAPDLTNKVVSALIGAPNINGVMLAALNAGAPDFAPFLDAVNKFKSTLGTSTKEIEASVLRRISTAMYERNLDDSVYAKNLRTIIVTANTEELKPFITTFEHSAEQIDMAAHIMAAAQQKGITLSIEPTTVRGISGATSARYLSFKPDDIKDAAAKIATEISEHDREALDTFTAYIRDLTKKSAKSGDIRQVLVELNRFRTQVNNGMLASMADTYVQPTDGKLPKEYKFYIENLSREMSEGITETLNSAEDTINKTVPRLLATYNDEASKVIRAVSHAIENGTLSDTLKSLSTEFNILTNVSRSLERALSIDPVVSKYWMSFADNFDKSMLNFADPFKYLDLDESVGKLLYDLRAKLPANTSLETVLSGVMNETDIAKYMQSLINYENKVATITAAYPTTANPSVKLPVFTVGDTDKIINDILEEAADTSKQITINIDEVAKAIAEAVSIPSYVLPEEAVKANVDPDTLNKMLKLMTTSTGEEVAIADVPGLDQAIKHLRKLEEIDALRNEVKAAREADRLAAEQAEVIAKLNAEAARNSEYAFNGDLDEIKKAILEDVQARRAAVSTAAAQAESAKRAANAFFVDESELGIDEFTKGSKEFKEFDEFFESMYRWTDDTFNTTGTWSEGVFHSYAEREYDDVLKYFESITHGEGLTGNRWANLALAKLDLTDQAVLDQLAGSLSDGEYSKFIRTMESMYSGWSDEAIAAAAKGESFGQFATADEFGKAVKDQLKAAFGDAFDDFEEKVFLANGEEITRGPLAARAYVDFANALQNNKFINKMLVPTEIGGISTGITGIDAAVALQRTVEALSAGADESMAAAQRWQDINSKYAIQMLDRNGKVDTDGNMADLMDAATVGGWSLLIEGALTSAISSAVSGAIAGSTASPIGTVAGAGAGLAAAIVASIGMALTGSFDVANIASEEIKEMLNNTDFAYTQAKQQGASDKEARDIQNKIARDLYLQYYNEMSSVWSMSDKSSIAELTESKGSFGARHIQTGTAAGATALRQAIAELTGNSTDLEHAGNNLVDASGNIQAMAYDAEKIYQQLYTLYTTGGMQNIEEYNSRSWFGKLKGGLTDLEEDWLWTIQDADDLTKARISDMFKLEIDAAAYIKEQGEEKIKNLLTSFGLASDNMQQMIEGVITLYNAAVTQFSQTLEAKAAFINTGTTSQLTLGTLSAGEGSVGRLLEGNLSNVDTQYLDLLHDATGLYVGAVSDTMYSLTADISDIKEKMTGFTATFPSTITVGADEIEVQSILSDTNAVSILNGMGININADGTVTIATEAVNANESGHERSMAYSLSDVSAYELSKLASRGINLNEAGADKVGITLDEAAMQSAIKGLTYNLTGIDLTSVSAAAVEALKAAGIALTQNQETGKTVATITDTSFITGSKTISELLAGLDPDTFSRMSDSLAGALKGIDVINEFGAKHGESRIGSAAGIELDTGFTSKEYSAALEQAFSKAGVTLKAAVNSEGNEAVYAAINNVGEQWHKAITQWGASDITPEMKAFLEELGAEVYESGSYTLVSTEGILDNLASGSKSRITEILFDNAEMWSQFPDDVKQAFIDAGLATEDGFIVLDGEALDGWHRFQVGGQEALAMAFSAMDTDTYAAFASLQGTTVKSYDALTNETKYWLGQLGITSEEEYNKNADSLMLLATNKMGLLNDGVMLKWSELSASQLVQLFELGITSEEQYNANMDKLKLASENGMDVLYEDTVLKWDELSTTTLDKLSSMGITTEEDYNAYLAKMNVTTGEGFSTIDTTTQQKLADLGVTTSGGWGSIKQVTDDTLSETEHLALGHMKFEDLPATVQEALGKEGVQGDLHDAWFAINSDADSALGTFSETVSGMAADLDRVKDLARQLKEALADPGLQAEALNANLASTAATALEAAKSNSNKWAEKGIGSFGRSYSYGRADSDAWANWNNNIGITSQLVAINEDEPDESGNPTVYYIYNLDVNGEPGQIIKNSDGVWRKYLGEMPYNADNVPEFKLGGMVTGDGLFRAGEFGLNEAIVPLEQPQAMHRIGSALAAAIPAYELVAPLKRMLGMRDGGVAQFSSFQREDSTDLVERIANKLLESQAHTAPQPSYMSNNDDKRPLYVGTLIADKAGLRELDRQMKRVVRQDGGR